MQTHVCFMEVENWISAFAGMKSMVCQVFGPGGWGEGTGSRINANLCAVRDKDILCSISLVDRPFVDRKRGFMHGFAQGRMRMYDAR